MNKFDAGAQPIRNGWIGFYRCVHESENRVLRDGKHDIIFPTKAEALQAAIDAHLAYLNSPITGFSTMECSKGSIARKEAEAVFRNGRRIEIERRSARA